MNRKRPVEAERLPAIMYERGNFPACNRNGRRTTYGKVPVPSDDKSRRQISKESA